MAGKKGTSAPPRKRPIERYEHTEKKRINNPQVGLVTAETDPVAPTHKTYDYITPVPSVKPRQELDYDPHLDPQLVWAGKKEHSSFEVPTVSLHVHERIDPYTIIKAVRKKNGNGVPAQPSLFERPEEHRPLREEIDFYKHAHGWSNRLIAGDSLLVMNSLLEKEGMAGQVQMVYIDPPYGKTYNSNFQPFVNKREVRDGKDEDLTQEPEMVRAFRDTWALGIHSYLTYLRDRLLLVRDLLTSSGSVFVQIGDQNLHHVRELMDEIFGPSNAVALVIIEKTSSATSEKLSSICDYLLWYAKDVTSVKYRQLYRPKIIGEEGTTQYVWIESPDGKTDRRMTKEELVDSEKVPKGWRIFAADNLTSQRPAQEGDVRRYEFAGEEFTPGKGTFKTDRKGLDTLAAAGRLKPIGKSLMYKRFLSDFVVAPVANVWDDTKMTGFTDQKLYVVQTAAKVISRCVLMTSDPGDLVLDPTCGSGTTAFVAEQWGRRWITCDTSRVALTLAKQRLMAGHFDYYELAHPEEGVGSGFSFRTVPHITLKSIANNTEIRSGITHQEVDDAISRSAEQAVLYDHPAVDNGRVRVTGPFTMEAVPAPTVRSLDDIDLGTPAEKAQESIGDFRDAATPLLDASVARKGATLRHSEWRDELLEDGAARQGRQPDQLLARGAAGGDALAACRRRNERRKARARRHLLRTRAQPAGAAPGGNGLGRGAHARSQAGDDRVCGL